MKKKDDVIQKFMDAHKSNRDAYDGFGRWRIPRIPYFMELLYDN